ncbi:helicase-related protein [Bombella saccharophila]|uniref:Helicase-related protein n=1 Tax=Bombella saccharophila TaxID=2967338 RepID=A0ABT3W4I6_9PROT|nr:helicase-related protein [Bombella saccharophila]MCX5613972.1 helicase-related protein [Bombella saccharophila]
MTARSSSFMPAAGQPPRLIHAILGPTNTGKTHYALTRMMAHQSGIIGFPLRLLARENYERLVKLKGERHVALLTGEEKIIPPHARWFSCTVEAMPLDRKVEFIAIDEIQLAADPDRGHIFTDRLLHARGTGETLFLGAETIRGLLKQLIPSITIETRARLSHLTNIGPVNLTRLPPRSAIVAFSATEVYAIAEAIRQKRGGCAIIMGRLSPRTRNAQVALYQNRDVDYLVATDAIGMGLNMDVDHVALAALHKFDGLASRALTPQEVAQITGRAGRGMRDGTFGTTGSCPPMSQELIKAVEDHKFEPLRALYWRQTALDYSSPETLYHSLMRKPPRPGLITGRTASDLDVLTGLMQMEDIRAAARGTKATTLLWEVCQIPDFRKLGDGSHTRLCGRLFLDLLKHHRIPPAWMEGQLRGLDRLDGDMDTLMHRLSGVRVCAYIAARTGWMPQSRHWQDRCRTVEDRLSDTLHERLKERFVNKRATALLRRSDTGQRVEALYAITPQNRILVEGHEIGRITGFGMNLDATADPQESALLLKAGKRALHHAMPARIRYFLQQEMTALHITEAGHIHWEGAHIASLTRGEDLFSPHSQLLPGEFRDTYQSRQVQEHLHTLVNALLRKTLAPFFQMEAHLQKTASLRGLAYRLRKDGGTTPTLPEDRAISREEKRFLHHHGVQIGEQFIYCPRLFKPAYLPMMSLLHTIWHGREYRIPHAGSICLPTADYPTPPPGWQNAGPVHIRLDKLDALLRLLRPHGKPPRHNQLIPPTLASSLGVKAALLPALLKGLGIAHHPPQALEETRYGPAAPLIILGRPHKHKTAPTRTKKARKPQRAVADSPFAALQNWAMRPSS